MAIEIVSFPIKNGGSFHSYVSLPEGTVTVPNVLPRSETTMKLCSTWGEGLGRDAIDSIGFKPSPNGLSWLYHIENHDKPMENHDKAMEFME